MQSIIGKELKGWKNRLQNTRRYTQELPSSLTTTPLSTSVQWTIWSVDLLSTKLTSKIAHPTLPNRRSWLIGGVTAKEETSLGCLSDLFTFLSYLQFLIIFQIACYATTGNPILSYVSASILRLLAAPHTIAPDGWSRLVRTTIKSSFVNDGWCTQCPFLYYFYSALDPFVA